MAYLYTSCDQCRQKPQVTVMAALPVPYRNHERTFESRFRAFRFEKVYRDIRQIIIKKVPHRIKQFTRWLLDCAGKCSASSSETCPERSGGRMPLAEKGAAALVPASTLKRPERAAL